MTLNNTLINKDIDDQQNRQQNINKIESVDRRR